MNSIIAYLLVSFLIGALPIGELTSRLKSGKTLIKTGTRTTIPPSEVFSLLGIPTGLIISLLDFSKGFLCSYPLAVYFLSPEPYHHWGWISLASLLCVIGHCNSPFLGFKGGRGLAPTSGIMATLLPIPAAFSLMLGLFLAFWGLSSKPGALSAAGAMPLLSILWVLTIKPQDLFYLYIVAFMSLWTFWEHRDELKSYMGIKTALPEPAAESGAEPEKDAETSEDEIQKD